MTEFNHYSPAQRKLGFFLAIKKQDGLIRALKWAWKNRGKRF